MSESSRSKWIMVGAVIGLLIGGLAGFLISPSPDISGYQEQIEQLETQVTTLQDMAQDLEEELENSVSIEYSDLEQMITQLQSKLEDVVSVEEYTTLENRFNELNSQLTSLQGEIDEKEDTIDELQKTISELEDRVPALPPTEGEPGSSMFFPADLGTPVVVHFYGYPGNFTAEITILEVIRGVNARQMIIDAASTYYPLASTYDPPIEGFEYMLVKIKFKIISASTLYPEFTLISSLFSSVASDGLVYPKTSISAITFGPQPQLYRHLYENQYCEGWGIYHVYETDEEPLLHFGQRYGVVYFKLYQ